mgnify:CR=1 FL=1
MKEDPKMYIVDGDIPHFRATLVSHPKEGGTETYIEDCSRPRKMQLNITPILYSLDLLKRVVRIFFEKVSLHKSLLILVLLGRKSLLRNFNELAEVSLRRHRIVLENYCVSALEFIRTLDKLLGDKLELLELTMILVTIFEYDQAYRCRVQYAFELLDVAKFNQNPVKELGRVLVEMERRDGVEGVRTKYRVLRKMLWLLYLPWIKRAALKFVNELDFSKVIMDEDDRWWIQFNRDMNNVVEFDFN